MNIWARRYIKNEKQREQRLKNKTKQKDKDCEANTKMCTIHIVGLPEGEENKTK